MLQSLHLQHPARTDGGKGNPIFAADLRQLADAREPQAYGPHYADLLAQCPSAHTASDTQWDAGRKCEGDVPRAARRPQTSEHGCSSMPSCCTHCMLRYRRTWTPQHPRAIRFHRQGKKNTCHVHIVTSTSHQSSCTRPWACGPSVIAREASLVSHPILMYPSFELPNIPTAPTPPPQKD
jgi:hypothetical protein